MANSADYATVIERYISSSDRSTLPVVLDELCSPIEGAYLHEKKDPQSIDLWPLWNAVAQIAKERGDESSQSNLIDLVQKIKTRDVLQRRNDATNEAEIFITWAGTVWIELPVLGASLREQWNQIGRNAPNSEWTNINSFAAQLTSSGAHDCSLFGLWSFRDALEIRRPRTIRETSEDTKQAKPGEEVPLESVLPATLEWLRYCSPILSRKCKDEGHETSALADLGKGSDHLGQLAIEAGLTTKGFSTGRWDFWLRRLEEIAGATDGAGGREKVAKLAYQGLERMRAQ